MKPTGNERADAFLSAYLALCQQHGMQLLDVGGAIPGRVSAFFKPDKLAAQHWYLDSTLRPAEGREATGGLRTGSSAAVNVIPPKQEG